MTTPPFSITNTLGLQAYIPAQIATDIDGKFSTLINDYVLELMFETQQNDLSETYSNTSDIHLQNAIASANPLLRVWRNAINWCLSWLADDTVNPTLTDATNAEKDLDYLTSLDYARSAAQQRIDAGVYKDTDEGRKMANFDSGLDESGQPIVDTSGGKNRFFGSFGELFAESTDNTNVVINIAAVNKNNHLGHILANQHTVINQNQVQWQQVLRDTDAELTSRGLQGMNQTAREVLAALQINSANNGVILDATKFDQVLDILERDNADGTLDGGLYATISDASTGLFDALKDISTTRNSGVSAVNIRDIDGDSIGDEAMFTIRTPSGSTRPVGGGV